jgi:hypothetical protein
MSYDYNFFRAKPNAHTLGDLTEGNIDPIGTVEEVKVALTAAFPKATWRHDSGWLDPDIPMGHVSQFDTTPQLRSFSVSRIEVPEVKIICSILGLVAFDGQKMLLIRP